MSELSAQNPTCRFSGLAELYARCRPDYPASAVDHILRRCDLKPGSLLVDVGSGTGISARTFAQRGLRVVGVEPNADMRRQAEAVGLPADAPVPDYRDGRAEATGLPDGVADVVLAAQAFHWFQADAALAEFRRILKPRGWVTLLWNERDETDPFTAAVGAVIRGWPGTRGVEGARTQVGEVLLRTPLFSDGERSTFQHHQELGADGLVGRVFSASYAPKGPALAGCSEAELHQVFARFQTAGRVLLRYQTTVYTARQGDHS